MNVFNAENNMNIIILVMKCKLDVQFVDIIILLFIQMKLINYVY